MSNIHTVLVAGATGRQGGAVAAALLARGHAVRALTRNPGSGVARALAAKGAIVVAGDLDDRDSIIAAAKGADTAFLMGNFYEAGFEGEIRQGIGAADAIKAAGIGHLIYSSVGSANRSTRIPHFDSKYRVEQHIDGLGIPYTIVAPVAFMENAVAPWAIEALRKGTHAFPSPTNKPLQLVAVHDIGAFVTSLVERREAVFGKRYDVAGDELSGMAQAAVLSAALGQPIIYFAVTPEMERERGGEDLARMAEWFRIVGYSADIAALRRDFPEVGWHSYGEWTRTQNWSAILAEPAAKRA